MRHIQKLSLLLVSLLVISSGVLFALFARDFQSVSNRESDPGGTVGDLTCLFTMLTVGFSPRIARMVGYKPTVQIGLIVTLLSGLLPIFTGSFLLLFVKVV